MHYNEFVYSITKKGCEHRHACIGMFTELGELVDALKKHEFYGKELDLENVNEELGDFRFYLQMAINHHKVIFDEFDLRTLDEKKEWSVPDLAMHGAGLIDAMYKRPYNKQTNAAVIRELYRIFELMVEHFGFEEEEILSSNMAKLKKRYPDQTFTEKDAVARADKRKK
jgi:hypothetical protein